MNTGRWRRTPAVIAPVPTQKASAFRPDANDDFGVTRPYPGALLERFADSDRRGDGEAFAVAEGHVELDHAKAPRGGIDGSVKPHQWPPRHGADNLHAFLTVERGYPEWYLNLLQPAAAGLDADARDQCRSKQYGRSREHGRECQARGQVQQRRRLTGHPSSL